MPVFEDNPLQGVEKVVKMVLGPLATVHPVSVVKNPLPENVPEIPAGPESGVKVTVGPITVNAATAKSPVGTPVTVSE